MTPDQLDEIEKLAELATPGPWGSLTFCLDGRVFTSDEFATNQDFLRTMRTFAMPLVKALREESAARDRAEAACFRLEVERNEARDRATIAERMVRELCDALQNSAVGRFAVAGELYTQALPRVDAALNNASAEIERLKLLAREAIDFAVVLSGAAPDEYYWEYDAQLKALEAKKP